MNRVDLKIVLLGSEFVGKTSLLERYIHDRFKGDAAYQNVCIFFLFWLLNDDESLHTYNEINFFL